jgi:type I restriction enzyme, S subunit
MSNVPKLRFSQFSGEWEEKKLDDYCQKIASGKSKQNDDGIYNLYGSTGIIGRTNEYSNNGKYILIARVGANAGLTNVVKGKFGVTDNTLVLEVNNHAELNFISFLLHKYNLNKLVFGSGQPLITGGQLKSLKFRFPSKQEQEKIASFLTSIDRRIEQLTKKEALFQEYKKGVMNKIFNQEVRFKDDDGSEFPEWEEKEIGNILKIGSGKDYKHLSDGNIPVYGTGGYMTSVNEYIYNGESVCIGRKGTIDKPVFLSGKFWTVDTLFYTHSFKDSIPKFVFSIFQTINWKLYNEASGVPSLSKSTIEKIKITIPLIQEQTKIANFLSSIDKKIELTTKELNSTKEFKKALLQQMFV